MDPRDLMRVSELAPLLGLTSGRVYQLLAAGEIPATRVGRAIRVPRPALDAWLQRCTAEANRNAKQAAARRAMSRPEPATDTERVIADAVQRMAEDHPFGWRGSATDLLGRLQAYRSEVEGDPTLWPLDGRSLSVVLRRLTVHLDRKGVRVSLGHRGHRGKRLITLKESPRRDARPAAAAASRPPLTNAAIANGAGSPRIRADTGDTDYLGYITVEVDDDGNPVVTPGDEE